MGVYKVNVSFDRGLLAQIDEAARELGTTRSGFVAEATARYVTDVRNLSAEEQRRKDIERAAGAFRRIGRTLPTGFDFTAQVRADRDRDHAGRGGA